MTVLCRAMSCCLQMVGRLLKFNNEVVYEHLLTPQVPFPLDYLEVVLSVCDIMCLIYAKFVEEVSCVCLPYQEHGA